MTVTSYMTNENDEDAFSLYLFDNPGIIEQDSFTCGVTAPARMWTSVWKYCLMALHWNSEQSMTRCCLVIPIQRNMAYQ